MALLSFVVQLQTFNPSIGSGLALPQCHSQSLTEEDRDRCDLCFYCTIGGIKGILRSQLCDGFQDCMTMEDERKSRCATKPEERFFCSALGGSKVMKHFTLHLCVCALSWTQQVE